MRIVQALGSGVKGGAERFFIRLAESFQKRGVDQTVVVRKGGWAQQQLEAAGVKTNGLSFGGALDVMTPFQFRRILRSAKADIVLTWMNRATRKTPRGPWIHAARLGNYYKMRNYRRCDHLIGLTPGITAYIKENGWPPERVDFIPNFAPVVRAKTQPRRDFNTSADAPLILWLGRMEHEKGPDIVVRALAGIPNAYLWMAGAGAFESEVKQIASDLGVAARIRFLGWRDDIHPLLEAAGLFVCASRFEAHGNIILEAWAHGLPVVSARSAGPEHLIAHGETGLLVEGDNPAAMAAALNTLIADAALRRRLGEQGHAHFLANYSEDAVVSLYLGLFQRLMRERGKAAA